MPITRIETRKRGPLVVRGEFEILDGEGKAIDLGGRDQVLLCRCGHSRSKPLCDGSHNRVGFEAPETSEE